jgi:hypothetical protein
MLKNILLAVVGFSIFLAGRSHASAEMDTRYGFHNLFVAVVNPDSDNVHAAHVQTVLERYFEARPRFDVSAGGSEALRQSTEKTTVADIGAAKIEQLQPWLDVARLAGADSALFVQMQRVGDSAQLSLVAAVTEPAEIVFRRVIPVVDKFSLASYGQSAEEGAVGFIQSLPFDATVISREGYRVVLDRGAPSFKAGNRVPIFTLENSGDGVEMKETGMIQIQRAEANLSFGTILVESKPSEVLKGNKARFLGVKPSLASGGSISRPMGFSRSLSSISEASSVESAARQEQWGNFDLDLAASLVSWNRTSTNGTASSTQGMYPGAALRAQVRLTNDTFVELNGLMGSASLTSSNLSSQANQLRIQVGYRLPLGTGLLAPVVFVRGGYSRSQFQVDDRPSVLGPSSASFEGLGLSMGCVYPLTEKWGVGLDMTALAFPALTESGGTSGAKSQDVTGWDFAVRGNYTLSDRLSLHAKLIFQTHSAAFTGVGTRPVSLLSLSQNTRALFAGASYIF